MKVRNYYFEKSNSKKFRRRPIITLPSSVHNDTIMLKKYMKQENKYNITQLKSIDDLENLRLQAKDRKTWNTIVKELYDAA